MTSVADSTVLVSERKTAHDTTDLIDAAERLSRKLRDRTGESFRTIRASAPLWKVTTASFPALRAYSAAAELEWKLADQDDTARLEGLQDTEFEPGTRRLLPVGAS